jgi:DNA-binding HxlR family transcriptional regulator
MNSRVGSYRERDRCPVYAAMQVIEGRWKPMVCRRLTERTQGFGELHRTMPGVTAKVLRQHLRQLEADGIVARSAPTGPRGQVLYRITPYGRTLGPVFERLWSWGVRHLARRVSPSGLGATGYPRIGAS